MTCSPSHLLARAAGAPPLEHTWRAPPNLGPLCDCAYSRSMRSESMRNREYAKSIAHTPAAQRRWRTQLPRPESGNTGAAARETTLSTRKDLGGSVSPLSRLCARADHGQACAINREFVHRLETKKAKESNPKCEINIEVLDYKPNLIIVSADESRVCAVRVCGCLYGVLHFWSFCRRTSTDRRAHMHATKHAHSTHAHTQVLVRKASGLTTQPTET